MSTSHKPRVDAGVPSGGEFTAHAHSDKVPSLGAPTVNNDFVAARLGEFGFAGDMSAEEIAQVTAELNASRDFRDENITAVADRVHLDTVGFTLSDANAAAAGMDHLTRLGHEDEAAALGRVMAALPGIKDADADDLVGVLDDLESLEINGYDHSIAGSAREKLRRVLNRNDIGIVTDELGQVSRDRPVPAPEADVFSVPGTKTRLHVLRPETAPDGKTEAVPASDPRLQAGEVFDNVQAPDGTFFHRRRDGVSPDEPSGFRIQANRPLTEAEKLQMAGLIGYAYQSTVRGEGLSMPESDSPYSFIIGTDTTKSRSDDLGAALQRFEDELPAMILDGSPVRSTNQAGPGTAGTRLVEGFNEPDLKFELYYDYVVGE